MPTLEKPDELIVSRYILSQVIQNHHIKTHFPNTVESCLDTLLQVEKNLEKILSPLNKPPKDGINVDEDKHKQTGDRV